MTSMSQQHHRHHHHHHRNHYHHNQAMTSWHQAVASAAAAAASNIETTPVSSYHHHADQYHNANQQLEPSAYQLSALDISTTDNSNSQSHSTLSSTIAINNQQQQQYIRPAAAASQRQQSQFYSSTSSPGEAASAADHSVYRKSSPTDAMKGSPSGLLSPKAHQSQAHHHQHHHQQHLQHSPHLAHDQYSAAPTVEPAMYQHSGAGHGRLTAATNLTYYHEHHPNYQDQCHQDYYQMINHGHQHQPQQLQQQQHLRAAANIDSFQQQAPLASTCWPTNLAQSTSPQVPTSPAIINHHHQFHLTTNAHQAHNPNQSPVSPLYANPAATYTTNGYPTQHHLQTSQQQQQNHQQPAVVAQTTPMQQQQQQQQHQLHYPTLAHNAGQHQHHHQSIIHHTSSQAQLPAKDKYAQTHTNNHHHHQHHQHEQQHLNHQQQPLQTHLPATTYSQFSAHRAPPIHQQALGKLNSPTINNNNSDILQTQTPQSVIQAHHTSNRHYGNAQSINAVAATSETLALNAASRSSSTGICGAAVSSPKPNLTNQNIVSSSATNPNKVINPPALCRRQSSSVSSGGSNLSDHNSQTDSLPGISPPVNAQVTTPVTEQILERRLDDGRLPSTVAANGDIEQQVDSKESQLGQLHQQCAVLLDEQQQQQKQQRNVAINQPNNNGTNASNSSSNNNNCSSNTTTSNTSSNGNNSGRSKRLRTSFKHNQLKEMKRWFSKNQNPDAKDLKTLAQHTGLSKRVLQVWFQNARAKFRRNNAKAANQQLYDTNVQHTSYMLQFQQNQQQTYHSHHHHHLQHQHHQTTRALQGAAANSLPINSHQQAQQLPPPQPPPLPQQQQQQQQQQLLEANIDGNAC